MIKYRRLRWADHVARMEEGRTGLKILIGVHTGKIAFGRIRRRFEDNITMDLIEIRRIELVRLRIEIIEVPL